MNHRYRDGDKECSYSDWAGAQVKQRWTNFNPILDSTNWLGKPVTSMEEHKGSGLYYCPHAKGAQWKGWNC